MTSNNLLSCGIPLLNDVNTESTEARFRSAVRRVALVACGFTSVAKQAKVCGFNILERNVIAQPLPELFD